MEARIIRGPEYEGYHNNSTLTIAAAWNELIDNAIDNGATDVWIENNGNSSTIRDNGSGIKNTTEDVERILMFHSGQNKNDEKKIGCYGLGIKEATMRLGKVVSIWSKATGYDPVVFDIPWYILTYDEKINCEKGKEIGIEHGTIITIFFDEEDIKNNRRLTPDKGSFKYYDKIIRERKLNIWDDEKLYSPSAIAVFDGKVKPDILDNVNYGGVKFDLKIGILAKTMGKDISGFYVYSVETSRYYQAGDKYLDGSISASDGLYISIGLRDTKANWRVDKNKRGVLNIDIVSKYLKEYRILDKWVTALYNGKKDETIKLVEKALNEIFGSVIGLIGKELREQTKEQSGTKHPKNIGIRREEAERVRETPEGYCKQRNPAKVKGYKVIEAYLDDRSRFLTVNRNGNELTVVLNRSNKRMLQLLINKNTVAVIMICYMAIRAELSQNKDLPHGLVYEIFRQNENFENLNM